MRSSRWLAVGAAVFLTPTLAAAVEYDDTTQVKDLRGLWLFNGGDNSSNAQPYLDDIGWKERRLPTTDLTWSAREAGHIWYRLHLNLGQTTPTADLALCLGAARHTVEVYFNGSLIGTRGRFGTWKSGGAHILPLTALIPSGLLERDNVIAVRIYDPSYGGGLVAGPLLVGPPNKILERLRWSSTWLLVVRVGLAALAFFVCLAQLILGTRGRGATGGWWLFGAGTSLALVHLSGIGLLELIPAVDFTARLQEVTTLLAILCLGSFFADRYEDIGTQRVTVGRAIYLFVAAFMALIPWAWFYFIQGPTILLAGLVATLYSANLCSQAVRRGEAETIPVFIGLSLLAMLIVYDGFAAGPADMLPPVSIMGAVAVIVLTALVQARQALTEHSATLERVRRMRHRLEGVPYKSLIEAATLPMLDAETFLGTTIHEMARDLQVRRCSLVLKHNDGNLRIRASVGLPKQVVHGVMKSGSISAYVYDTGKVLTPANLPEKLVDSMHGRHITTSFMSVPVRLDDRIFGVLNLSDRNDGGEFGQADEAAALATARKLALAINLLPPEVLVPPQAPRRPRTIRAERLDPNDPLMMTELDALQEAPEPAETHTSDGKSYGDGYDEDEASGDLDSQLDHELDNAIGHMTDNGPLSPAKTVNADLVSVDAKLAALAASLRQDRTRVDPSPVREIDGLIDDELADEDEDSDADAQDHDDAQRPAPGDGADDELPTPSDGDRAAEDDDPEPVAEGDEEDLDDDEVLDDEPGGDDEGFAADADADADDNESDGDTYRDGPQED